MFIDMRARPDCQVQTFFQEDIRILYASLFASLESTLPTVGVSKATKFAINVGLQVLSTISVKNRNKKY